MFEGLQKPILRVTLAAQFFFAILFFALISPQARAQSASAGNDGAGMWTWMSGSNTADQLGVYGTKGTPAVGNVPPSRESGSTWIDSNGNFWLFGGTYEDFSTRSSVALNDLWQFNPSTNEWTWVSGGSTPGQAGVYGTLGKSAAGNFPGAREGANSWIDRSGNLWLFGGEIIEPGYKYYNLNDLWKFNPATKEWAWMGGSSTVDQSGVYGTKGTPAPENTPGARGNWECAAANWTDNSGNFWLFGGCGFDVNGANVVLNDFWKFDPSINEWAWMGGSNTGDQPGVYGTPGVLAAGNIPGARNSAAAWTDSNDNLWLFGGDGYVQDDGSSQDGTSGALNDLWKFNIPSGKWAWMGGSSATNQLGVYGTLGTPASGNGPSARTSPLNWIDRSGNLWLFGGGAIVSEDDEVFDINDLWKFDISTNEWTWMGGSGTPNQPAVYGTLGQPAPGNLPGGREYASSWTDSRGNLWLFGGEDAATHGTLNDLWKYQPAILAQATTTTVSSDANPASVGTTVTFTASVAVTSGSAIPTGSVDFTVDGSTALTAALDAAGQATYSTSALTAGPHTVAVNYAGATGFAASTSPDLTETIAIPVAAAPAFSPAAGSYTSAQAVTITSATTNATVYYTTDGSTPTTASTPYKDAINVSTTETLQAIAVAGGYSDSVVSTAAYAITLSNPTPVISNTDPAYTRAGGAGFAITVSGSGFTTGSTVYWGSIALTTQYVSDTRLTASITASEIANAGATAITVQSPAPGGGTSTAWQFEVDSASSTTTGPTLSSTTATVTAGAAASYPVTLPSTVSGVSITCLNLPAGATCSYSSSTHTVTIATSSTTLKGAYPVTLVITQTVTVTAAATILLPLLLPLVLMRKRLVARGAWFTACLGLVLLAAAAFSTGCGGGAKTPQTTTSTVKTSAVVDLIVQ